MSQALTLDLDLASAPEHEVHAIEEELTRELNTINEHSDEYRSEGENIGWQNTHGSTTVTLTDGSDLLRKLAPDTPCRMEFEITDHAIIVTVFHHDSPTGETHTITAAE